MLFRVLSDKMIKFRYRRPSIKEEKCVASGGKDVNVESSALAPTEDERIILYDELRRFINDKFRDVSLLLPI